MKVFLGICLLIASCCCSAVSRVGPQARIINGIEATPHQFPYQAGMWIRYKGWTTWCGGSLISPEWVLTAAHCLQGVSGVRMVLGAHHLYFEEQGRYEVEIGLENIVLHEGWDPMTIKNDIALVRLAEPVQLSSTIQTIALPKRHTRLEAFDGRIGTLSGWGLTEYGDTSVLLYVDAELISNDRCTRDHSSFVQETNICVSGEGFKAACHGDSGGPLVVDENNTPLLVGITSFGSESCLEGKPSVFTRVERYLDWISSKTGLEFE